MDEYQRDRENNLNYETQVAAVNHLGETVTAPRTFNLLYEVHNLNKSLHHITLEVKTPEELTFLEQFAGKHDQENPADRLYISLQTKGQKRPITYSIRRNHKNSQYPNEITLSTHDLINPQSPRLKQLEP